MCGTDEFMRCTNEFMCYSDELYVLHGCVLCAARMSCMCCTDELYVRLGRVVCAARMSCMCDTDELYLRHG